MSEPLDPILDPQSVPIRDLSDDPLPSAEEPLGPIANLPSAIEDPWGGRSPTQTVAFMVYDVVGRILRTGHCALRDLIAQAQGDEVVMEGHANDRLQKVVDGRVVDKTAEELAALELPVIPPEKQRAFVSQEDWDLFQSRFAAIEERLRRIEPRPSGL